MRGTLPPHPPTTARLTLLLFCSAFLSIFRLFSLSLQIHLFYRVRVRLTEKKGAHTPADVRIVCVINSPPLFFLGGESEGDKQRLNKER